MWVTAKRTQRTVELFRDLNEPMERDAASRVSTRQFSFPVRLRTNVQDSARARENRNRHLPPSGADCDVRVGLAWNCYPLVCARRARASPCHGRNRFSDD